MDQDSRSYRFSDSGIISSEVRLLASCFKAASGKNNFNAATEMPVEEIVLKAQDLYDFRKDYFRFITNAPLPVVVTSEAELALIKNTMLEIAGIWAAVGDNVYKIDGAANLLESRALRQGILEERPVKVGGLELKKG